MSFVRAFLYSLRLPQKKAMFQLNRIGMDITIIYLFILLMIVSLPALFENLSDPSTAVKSMNTIFYLVYFFMVYYISLNVIIFSFLSLLAYIGTLIARMLQRKIRFQTLWKLCAFTTTLPFLIYTIIAFIHPVHPVFLIFLCIYSIIFLIKMITVFPKRKKRVRP